MSKTIRCPFCKDHIDRDELRYHMATEHKMEVKERYIPSKLKKRQRKELEYYYEDMDVEMAMHRARFTKVVAVAIIGLILVVAAVYGYPLMTGEGGGGENGDGDGEGDGTSDGTDGEDGTGDGGDGEDGDTVTEINWYHDYEAGMSRAESDGKPVMIDFYTDSCGYCKMMDEDTYSDQRVIDESTRFVSIEVDGNRRQDLLSEYEITGFPTAVFLNKNGAEANRVVGYKGPDEFLVEMKKV